MDSFDALCRLSVRKITHENSGAGKRIKRFGLALKASPPFLSRAKQLIFLCGANKSAGNVSERRSAIKRFVQSISPQLTVLYAEGIFSELAKLGNKTNALDIEHGISQVADKIVIVLESESAFCELGAFAHKTLRDKLIVVNNSKFRNSLSFINTGPIAAAEEAKAPVLWYEMADDGVHRLDGIGEIFSKLRAAVKPESVRPTVIPYDELIDLGMRKSSLYFIHDLVLFTGPIRLDELIDVLKILFPEKKSFDAVKNLLGVLREGELLHTRSTNGKWIYEATSHEPFLRYVFDTAALTAACREYHYKTEPSRYVRG